MTDSIHTAINSVMSKVGYVQKERKQGLNYSFASEKALIEAIRPAMVENGIFMYVVGLDNVETKSYETKGGSTMNHTMITGTVRFAHAASQTFIDAMAIGEGADTGDKSANKAMTAMYKYAMRQTFCIETGDDPDGTSSIEQERKSVTKAAEKSIMAPEKAAPKTVAAQKAWMKEANVFAKEAGSSIREALKLAESDNLLIEMEKWQAGNGYTDEEALAEFKGLVAVKVVVG